MRIWILRHGEAERETRHDPDRALTERGRRDAEAAGQLLAAQVPPELLVVASPYKRAQQTAQAALLAMPNRSIISAPWLQPETDPREVLRELEKLAAAAVLLVSHQPLVSALAGVLTSGDYRDGPALQPASLLELQLSHLATGCGELRSLRHAPDFREAAR